MPKNSKAYGSLPILKGVDIAVEKGKSSVLLVLQELVKVHCCTSLVPWISLIRERFSSMVLMFKIEC
jgi:hypothetical protein